MPNHFIGPQTEHLVNALISDELIIADFMELVVVGLSEVSVRHSGALVASTSCEIKLGLQSCLDR